MPEEKSAAAAKIEKIPVKTPDRDFEVPGRQLEKPATPEQAPERPQKPEEVNLEESDSNPEKAGPTTLADTVSPQRKERQKQVESILERDLKEIYLSLPDNKKQEFRAKGEETTQKIVDLLERGKAKAREVMKLIMNWLKIIPGVNRFFLEQEAKIKTDEILELGRQK